MIKWIIQIIKENFENFGLTNCIARMDLRKQHNASDFGLLWAVVKPSFYLIMFYFAISVGFRSAKDIEGSVCPYFIWLACGIVQWQFISDLLVWGAGCYQRHAGIIKNRKFPLTTVPLMPVLSRFYIYISMTFMLMIVAMLMGVKPSIYWLQLPVYILLTVMFCYVWSMMTALMSIISADSLEFIKTIKTAFFWLSGILFNVRTKHHILFKINPISYLAEGFRNCFAFHTWIWEEKRLFMYFAIVMMVMMTFTYLLYRRLEKRIPELLI